MKRKANKQWIWLAMDATTRQIIAFHVGDRSRESAKALWVNIPLVYREQATFHTDQYDAYTGVIPAERHKAITKKARKTNHIERFNNTLRQRVSRLVCETLSFSKKLANPIGAKKLFLCHDNLTRAAAYNEPSLDIPTASDTLVAHLPLRPARFSHDSNILRKYGTEGAGHLHYSPLMHEGRRAAGSQHCHDQRTTEGMEDEQARAVSRTRQEGTSSSASARHAEGKPRRRISGG